jgi:adenine deaminase
VGVDDGDMARAIGRLSELGGGMVAVEGRGVRAELPLPVAGLLSDQPLAVVLEQSELLSAAVRALGCAIDAPFHAMGFLALSVIPALKLTDRGLVDVAAWKLVPLEA